MGSKPSQLLGLLAGFALLLGTTACVDSEVSGSARDSQTTGDPDTGNDTTIPDTDTTQPDSIVVTTCGSDQDCAQQLAGTLGACDVASCNLATERCEVETRSNCCETIADCPLTGAACTEFQCPVPGAACVAVDVCPPCQLDRDCDAQAPTCSRGRCSEGTCFFEPLETCCVDAADCDDADICTDATCGDGVCGFDYNGTPGCCLTAPIVQTSFDDGVAFTATSDAPDAGWSTLETRFTPTPDFTLYLGNAARLQNVSESGAYRAEARFRIGFTAPNSEIEIKFQTFIDLRRAPEVDRFRVVVRTLGGEERLVYTKTVAPTELWHWVKRTIRIESGGETELAFIYESGSGAEPDETTFGVMVDDLQVRTGCGEDAGCEGDVQCQVDDPCVVGACGADRQCTFETVPGCCRADLDCNGNPDQCADGVCLNNRCQTEDVEGCCVNDTQCPESPDPCFLQSVCEDGRCDLLFVDIPCDDGNTCTADFCVNGACQREPIPGCCEGPDCPCDPSVAAFDFQDSAQGWGFDAPAAGFGWIRAQLDQPGQPELLYFGNPVGPNLDPGFPLTSVATSPAIDLPTTAASITVEFQVIVAFEGGPEGLFTLEAVTESGQAVVLWSLSAQTPRLSPEMLSSDALSPLAGQRVNLRVVYRDTDNQVTDGFGFLIDDIIVQADCGGGGDCVVDSQCPPEGPCTQGACEGGNCQVEELRCEIDDPCFQGFCDPAADECVVFPIGGPECQCASDDDCADFDPCTRETCEGGQCLREFDPNAPGCAICQTGQDCRDGNPCTRDRCDANGVCRNEFDSDLPGCGFCMGDAECDDGSACTQDFCGADGVCQTQPIPGCCGSTEDCIDNDPCTESVCLQAVGLCFNPTVPGCCSNAADCQDFDVCTADRCNDGQCENPTIGGPGCQECVVNGQCDDDDPCTRDRCRPNGTCRNVPAPNLPGCNQCDGDDQCEDGNACTVDFCGPDGRCFSEPSADCCDSAGDCADGNRCTEDVCVLPDGVCANQPIPGCCGAGGECDDGNVCTIDVCQDDGTCENVVDPACPVCTPTSCNDTNNCTIDTCSADGVCNNEQLPLCCDDLSACDDGDICTQDICGPAGIGCVNQPIAGCCASATGCDDNNSCTRDRCQNNTCENVPLDIPECQGCEPGSCDDGNICTQDLCNAFTGACQNLPIDECCTGAFQCGDGDICTFDQCQDNQCLHIPLTAIPGCAPDCMTDDDCEDNNPCTDTACQGGTCQIDVDFGCCDADADCAVDDPCTVPLCLEAVGVCVNPPRGCNDFDNCTNDFCDPAAGGCVNERDPSCCTEASQCDDMNPCTIDGCVNGVCAQAPSPDCCSSDDECFVEECGPGQCTAGSCTFDGCCDVGPTGVLCDDGNVCTQDECAADGACLHSPEPGCCQRDSDCPASPDLCTLSRCDLDALVCVTETDPDCCTASVGFEATFEDGQLPGWSTTTANDGTTWSVSQQRARGGQFSLYGGRPGFGEYGDNADIVARTPTFEVPDAVGAELSMETFISLESGNFDDFTISLVLTDTNQLVELYATDNMPGDERDRWVSRRFNLTAFMGQRVQLQFRLDSDFSISAEGIYIDSIELTGVCEPVTICSGDGECSDGDVCTSDRCVGGSCEAAPIAGCCESDAECDDDYACTTDACVQGDCRNALIADCCVFNSECDDGRACTEDRCDTSANACLNVDTDGDCCGADTDCDDGDACTQDRCRPNGTCGNRPDFENPACCEAGTFFDERFNAFALPTFSVVTDGSDVHWQVFNGQVLSSPFALYYGNPETGNYDNGGRTFGSATSDGIQVPNTAQNPTLSFGYWEELDGFFFDDFIEVKILIGDEATSVWDRTELNFDGSQTRVWVPVEVPLPAAAIGRTVRLQFEFDSNDDFGNQGEGAYFDNIRVFSECQP